jgi:hypothetical protein
MESVKGRGREREMRRMMWWVLTVGSDEGEEFWWNLLWGHWVLSHAKLSTSERLCAFTGIDNILDIRASTWVTRRRDWSGILGVSLCLPPCLSSYLFSSLLPVYRWTSSADVDEWKTKCFVSSSIRLLDDYLGPTWFNVGRANHGNVSSGKARVRVLNDFHWLSTAMAIDERRKFCRYCRIWTYGSFLPESYWFMAG